MNSTLMSNANINMLPDAALAIDSAMLSEQDHLYLLIDGAQTNRLLPKIQKNRYCAEHLSLFDGTLEEANADVAPYLVRVKDLSELTKAIDSLKSTLRSEGALSVLVTPLSADALKHRLIERLNAKLPDNFDCLLRFFDARVLPHLHQALNPAQQAAFFGPVKQWWYPSHQRQWKALSVKFAEINTFESPLELNDQQQNALIDALYPYSVIEHFMITDEALLDSVAPADRYAFFARLLKAAAQYGIDGGATAILFCTLGLTRGPDFYEQADWQSGLNRVKRGEITLQQAVKAHHD